MPFLTAGSDNVTVIVDEVLDCNKIKYNCYMKAFFSFDLFMVYIPEYKQPLRTMK